MSEENSIKKLNNFTSVLKKIFIGKARDLEDRSIFGKLSLVAFFAWVGLGADALTSSCYGPEEAYRNLGGHTSLSIFIGLGTAITIFVISTSYSQIIQLFPFGGGGYLVASKLLSPTVGMVSGCALIIDYVLTITLSISSGADALFSFFPAGWQSFKLATAILAVLLLIVMNLRGVKESVFSLTPIFILFMVTHVFAIIYVLSSHISDYSAVTVSTSVDIKSSFSQLGMVGTIFIILRAYSMGAGTYTGIEAVSNGLPVLREPRVRTGKRTMKLMSFSLAFMVIGLMLSYSLFHLNLVPNKTLNAVLFERISIGWGHGVSRMFVLITLVSEAALLFVAAQTGFLDGPRIMANMAKDMWFPKRFASLSDRLVARNGIMLMGIGSLVLLVISKGSVSLLIVLYSINVFITFTLSQLGMVKHWWQNKFKVKRWFSKLTINGIGLILTSFILIMVTIVKFGEGGWITLLITGILVIVAFRVRKHYYAIAWKLHHLQGKISTTLLSKINQYKSNIKGKAPDIAFKKDAKTAIIVVSGYDGTGIHTLFSVIESFGGIYQNFVFIQIGVIDSGNFKGIDQIDKLRLHVKNSVNKYVTLANQLGYYSRGFRTIGTDIVFETDRIISKIIKFYPNSTIFGGQLVFSEAYSLSRVLHNHTIFALQRRLYKKGITTVILPIHVD